MTATLLPIILLVGAGYTAFVAVALLGSDRGGGLFEVPIRLALNVLRIWPDRRRSGFVIGLDVAPGVAIRSYGGFGLRAGLYLGYTWM